MEKRKSVYMMSVALVLAIVSILVFNMNIQVEAAGFIENVVDDAHLYSRYDLSNYQLDFYVDSSGGWLPWNWGESIGQSVMYGIYALTNVLWWLSCLVAQGAGYIVQEAFRLDFIDNMAGTVGRNIQTLAGVSPSGISSRGFYSGCLSLLILIVGIYVIYTGAFKHETTKALSAVTSFVVIFVLSAVLIAYAPEMISNVNDFSKDMSGATLELGLQMMGDDTGTDGSTEGSTATIRDTLWRIQVDAPWELLQFGSVGEVDSSRVEALKAISPDEENGKTREDAVKAEVTEQENMNMSTPKVMSRLGMVLFLFLMSLIISIFVFLLSGFMLFTQILFIIYATYLPISFLLAMVPTFNGMSKKAVLSLFNTIMLRVGITLAIVVTFSISYLLYTAVGNYPFLLIMFIQIVVFVGTFIALPEILRMVTFSTGDQKAFGVARQVAGVMLLSRMRKNNRNKLLSNNRSGIGKSGSDSSGSGGSDGNGAGRKRTGNTETEKSKLNSPGINENRTSSSGVEERTSTSTSRTKGGIIHDKFGQKKDDIEPAREIKANARKTVSDKVEEKGDIEGNRQKKGDIEPAREIKANVRKNVLDKVEEKGEIESRRQKKDDIEPTREVKFNTRKNVPDKVDEKGEASVKRQNKENIESAHEINMADARKTVPDKVEKKRGVEGKSEKKDEVVSSHEIKSRSRKTVPDKINEKRDVIEEGQRQNNIKPVREINRSNVREPVSDKAKEKKSVFRKGKGDIEPMRELREHNGRNSREGEGERK